jgi:hypothetical protein
VQYGDKDGNRDRVWRTFSGPAVPQFGDLKRLAYTVLMAGKRARGYKKSRDQVVGQRRPEPSARSPRRLSRVRRGHDRMHRRPAGAFGSLEQLR